MLMTLLFRQNLKKNFHHRRKVNIKVRQKKISGFLI